MNELEIKNQLKTFVYLLKSDYIKVTEKNKENTNEINRGEIENKLYHLRLRIDSFIDMVNVGKFDNQNNHLILKKYKIDFEKIKSNLNAII